MFCTSEPNKVFHALKDRLKEMPLENYSLDELSKIFAKYLPKVQFEDGVLAQVATVVRGNARNAWKVAMDAREYLQGADTFMVEDWNELKKIYNILPLGLNPIELGLLRYLNDQKSGISLTRLSAKSGMSRDALQKDCELYLQKHDLMAVETKGRVITKKGQEYLKSLDAALCASPTRS
jgi:Holliday junction resolvasome RuvABC ATP-dependent DNA helicase subunit